MWGHPNTAHPQMQAQAVGAEQQLATAMERIGLLEGQTDALKVKRANNSLAATRAQEAASVARDRAGEAKQVLEGPLRDRYRAAQELVQHRAQGARQAGDRAQQLREEAAGLLEDAQGKLRKLQGEAGEGGWAGGDVARGCPHSSPPISVPSSAGEEVRAERGGAGRQGGAAGRAGGQDEGGVGHHQPAGPDLQHLPVMDALPPPAPLLPLPWAPHV